MRTERRPVRSAFMILSGLFLAAGTLVGHAQAMTSATSVNGTIASISATAITLTLADGLQKTVTLQGTTTVLERQVATVDQIKPGDALGVAARRDNGKLTATGINIFAPQMWDGIRKGQFPMTTGEVMTNAVVTDYVQSVQGSVLTMKYSDGTASIVVPADVPIHRLVSLKLSDLTVGLHVVIRGTANPDGTFRAATVSFDQPAKG